MSLLEKVTEKKADFEPLLKAFEMGQSKDAAKKLVGVYCLIIGASKLWPSPDSILSSESVTMRYARHIYRHMRPLDIFAHLNLNQLPQLWALFEAFDALNKELKYSYNVWAFNDPRINADYLMHLRDK